MESRERKAHRTVLQIVPELETGGAERTAVDVAAELVARGWRAIVVSAGGRLVPELEAAGAKHIAFPAATKNPALMLANAFRLAGIVRSEEVDILHARSRAPAWSALLAARLTGTPFVTTYHGAYNQKNALKGFYNSVMARGDVVIANSAYTARLIAARHKVAGDGAAGERVVVIHRGTDLADYAEGVMSPSRLDALRTAWGLEGDAPVILHLARLTGWKGQTVLIDALARLAAEGRDVVGILAGDAQGRTDYVANLERRIADHGLEGRVRLVGHCADPAAAMHLADVVAVPSSEPEAFGRAAVEAQAAGRPVVVSDLGAVPETVLAPPEVAAAERTGWRVPASDPAALAGGLGEALDLDREARAALAGRATAHVRAHFSLDAMTAATLRQYERLLGA
ncbi:glycosyltransferase involved in cell wall biosynthesis [Rhodobium orientis]|uniref:Glycosyl transferase n=1 Tax=Rhodobium orientis TaxID=34017 RepID=A0A327JH67_9HYPH|nr:glycosyltransferase family 4 protein [Rhodobium orientis]MBB4303443.1 glycosyltransferase involved in cell wall biosynthesis [Rhodobium orientis]MBK5950377.1 glycosyl transferase [Rhodobium orientis]RAI25016.1 glycosyl transferase [Rhodobium orientis]